MYIITLEEFKSSCDESQLAQLTNDASGDSVDDDVLTPYVNEGESLVESLAGARYTIPFTLDTGYTEYDGILKRLVKAMTFAILEERRGWTVTQEQKDIMTWAQEFLNAIRLGNADIPHCILSSKVHSSVVAGVTRTLTQDTLIFFG